MGFFLNCEGKKSFTLPLCFCCWSFFALLQYMEFGRSGPHGVYVHLHVVEAKEQGQGRAHLLSMGEGHVKDLKHITSLVISLYAQVSVFVFMYFVYVLRNIKSTTFIPSHWKMWLLVILSCLKLDTILHFITCNGV